VYFSHSAPSHLYPLSLHDALPICLISSKVQDTMRAIRTFAILGIAALYLAGCQQEQAAQPAPPPPEVTVTQPVRKQIVQWDRYRSEEHTSELQSRENLVCRLLLEK